MKKVTVQHTSSGRVQEAELYSTFVYLLHDASVLSMLSFTEHFTIIN